MAVRTDRFPCLVSAHITAGSALTAALLAAAFDFRGLRGPLLLARRPRFFGRRSRDSVLVLSEVLVEL